MSPQFTLFLVSHLDNATKEQYGFDVARMEALSDHVTGLFRQVRSLSGKSFSTTVIWDPTSGEVDRYWRENAGIVHVSLNNGSRSIVRRANGPTPPNNAQGFTAQTPKGVVAEVYIEGGNTLNGMGHRIFHELMHFKLDVGQGVVTSQNGIHDAGGGAGLATGNPLRGTETLTTINASLMGGHLLDNIKMAKTGLL